MEFQKAIIAKIADHLGVTPQDIDPDASLKEDLGLGPIETADLLAVLSKEFGVTFTAMDVARVESVSDLVDLIEDLSLEE